MANENVVVELTRDQAIVFSAWLARLDREGADFEDQAEQRVLWDIEATLEAVLVEPLDPRYDELLQAARARVRDPE